MQPAKPKKKNNYCLPYIDTSIQNPEPSLNTTQYNSKYIFSTEANLVFEFTVKQPTQLSDVHSDSHQNQPLLCCFLLVSGGQILEGHIKLLVERHIPMIPSKVTHCPTEEGVNSENTIPHS